MNDVIDEIGLEPPRPNTRQRKAKAPQNESSASDLSEQCGVSLDDFYAYMPGHSYLYRPTRELCPASSVDGRIPPMPMSNGKKLRPSAWLDRNKPVEQMTWHPGEPELIYNRVLQVSGWAPHPGAAVFNLYRAPNKTTGDASKAGPWRQHLERVYPAEAEHIERWLAQRVQTPGEKVNHALVLGGAQGIGKDTVLEPVKAAVGPWNVQEVSPTQVLGRFNGWAKATLIRISEARDLGDVDRFAFYAHTKALIAAPPDVIRVDEKNLREHYVANVCGVVITTNHKTDGLYLPADDHRHYVAWSELTREAFDSAYWTELYRWYSSGGSGHVAAYLRALDLSGFDPKAPPPKTPAFWAVVQAGEAPESGELRDVIEKLHDPDALTVAQLIDTAKFAAMHGISEDLAERKNRRAVPHRLERVGYVPVRNPDADDGLFKVDGRRCVVYARKTLPLARQIQAARSV